MSAPLHALTEALKYLVPLGYLGATVSYGFLFFSKEEEPHQARSRLLLLLSLLLHTGLLLAIALEFGRCPLATWGEGLLFFSWLVGLIHFASELIARTYRLGFFTLLPVTAGIFLSLALLHQGFALPPERQSSFLVFHIVASLASYACFCMAAVLASLYLLLYTRLKHKRFDLTFRKLPPLDRLDRLSASWSALGALTMVVSSVIGFLYVKRQGVEGMGLGEATIYAVLVLFLGAALSRRLFGFRGRRHALTVLAGFGVLVFLNLFQAHGFGT